MHDGDATASPAPRLVSRHWPTDRADRLSDDEIQLWWIDLRISPERRSALARLLDADERRRAAAFKYDDHQRRFIARRAARREILGSLLGAAPRDLCFAHSPLGRPSLAAPTRPLDLRFSASHSEEYAIVAIAGAREIGVDIETIRPLDDLEHLLDVITSPDERRAVDALPPGERTGVFFRCWTAKEAYLKATGEGLTRPLRSFSVLTDPARPPTLAGAAKLPACRFHDISRPALAGTLALLDS